jgi:type I restriction enzyme S subunit
MSASMTNSETENNKPVLSDRRRVPELRFKEFDGEWTKMKLASVSDKITDGTHFSPQLYEQGNYKYISSKNIRNGYMILDDVPYVSDEVHKEIYSRCDVKFNDILLTKDGASTGNVCLNELHEEFSLLSSVAMIRCDAKGSINEYVYQYICSPYGQYEIRSTIAGQAITRITLEKLRGYKFCFPPLPEQQKIASFLSAIDDKVQQLTKKKELLENYKKGVMQQLFTGQLRFKAEDGNDYPDWEEKRLGDLIKLQGGNAFKSLQFKKEGIPIIRISNISNKTKYLDLEKLVHYDEQIKDANYIIEQGDLLIAMSGATTGKSSISDFEGKAYLNQRVGLFKSITNELEYGFLIQFVFSDLFSNQLDGVLVAGAQPNISSKDIENFKLNFPCLEEQQKIATYLSGIDTKIESVNTQITQTQTFKKGLLQLMFV